MVTTMLFAAFLAAAPAAPPKESPRIAYVRTQLVSKKVKPNVIAEVFKRLTLRPRGPAPYISWAQVRTRLTSADTITRGRAYLNANETVFASAERTYGVPRTVIAALIAMETDYGAPTGIGTVPVMDALYTRMLRFSEDRWQAEADELVSFVAYCLPVGVDTCSVPSCLSLAVDACQATAGSYAGALGLVQFRPTSIASDGVDGNGDGRIDLFNPADAIPSAANFLVRRGWKADDRTAQLRALARYYGSPVGYPPLVLECAELLSRPSSP
jgi:membrane-bound lytic murein transglycosylase B